MDRSSERLRAISERYMVFTVEADGRSGQGMPKPQHPSREEAGHQGCLLSLVSAKRGRRRWGLVAILCEQEIWWWEISVVSGFERWGFARGSDGDFGGSRPGSLVVFQLLVELQGFCCYALLSCALLSFFSCDGSGSVAMLETWFISWS